MTSEAEIERIDQIVSALLGGSYTHAKGSGTLSSEEILVIAPYNVQVNRLRQRLDGKVRVGTVDKFQEQEAPVENLSLPASSGDDAPRGAGLSALTEPCECGDQPGSVPVDRGEITELDNGIGQDRSGT